ncbi:hypothetical protein VPH35_037619 [Triticum aestivum]
MTSATTSTAMALIVLAAMSFDALPTAHADADFISRTCRKTNNATVCLAMLSANPKSAYGTTEHDLTSIALEIAISIEKEGTPEEDTLLVCHNAYIGAHNDLDLQARLAFEYADYAGASKVVSLAKVVGDACENAFKRINKKSPVTGIDQQMTEHCGVTADLMDVLVPK